MSLADAKRLLQWEVVSEALAAANVDAETIALVEHARSVDEVVHGVASCLIGSADGKQTKNYVKVEMSGMLPPFDRAYVELIRPGGHTSHELREKLRDSLSHVRRVLSEGAPTDDAREALVQEIELVLAAEAP